MRANRLKQIWDEGRTASNFWLTLASPYVAEVVAHQGWDSATIDLQHGAVDATDVYSMLTALSTTDCVPLVRVPWNEPGIIMKMLDAGAYGIIAPMINSRAECEAFVGACRYAPKGYRSVGPNRAVLYGGPDYLAKANNEVLALAMIETRQALENVEDIAAVPGLDALLIGPADLSLSLGKPISGMPDDPDVVAAIERIIAAARGAGLRTAFVTQTVEYARKLRDMGVDLVTFGADVGLLRAGAELVTEFREG